MRYTINYNSGKEAGKRVFVNTDQRYTRTQTITGATIGATIDQRAKRRNKRANAPVKTDMRKRFLLLAVVLVALFYFAPKDQNSQAPTTPETPAQAEELPPSYSVGVPQDFESADPPAGWKGEEVQTNARVDLYDKYFGTEATLARAICTAENGTQEPGRVSKPNRNGTLDYGLCQINSIHADKVGGNLELLKDPEINIKVAKQIRDGSGWTAWTCYKNGSYKKHL